MIKSFKLKTKIYFSLISLMLSTSLQGKPFLKELKNLNLLKEEYADLDPVTGFVWVEGGVLENFGELSDSRINKKGEMRNKLKHLINSLFHRVDGFIPSTSPHSITPFMEPYNIGVLLGYLYKTRKDIKRDKIKEILSQEQENKVNKTTLRKFTCLSAKSMNWASNTTGS